MLKTIRNADKHRDKLMKLNLSLNWRKFINTKFGVSGSMVYWGLESITVESTNNENRNANKNFHDNIYEIEDD